jgi:hypothetical protein
LAPDRDEADEAAQRVSFYVAVSDPQAMLDRAEALGGATALP